MVAQVDVITGKRTVLHYLIDPVLKVRDNAFRD
jgi:adhesin transport system membrane fusion protein